MSRQRNQTETELPVRFVVRVEGECHPSGNGQAPNTSTNSLKKTQTKPKGENHRLVKVLNVPWKKQMIKKGMTTPPTLLKPCSRASFYKNKIGVSKRMLENLTLVITEFEYLHSLSTESCNCDSLMGAPEGGGAAVSVMRPGKETDGWHTSIWEQDPRLDASLLFLSPFASLLTFSSIFSVFGEEPPRRSWGESPLHRRESLWAGVEARWPPCTDGPGAGSCHSAPPTPTPHPRPATWGGDRRPALLPGCHKCRVGGEAGGGGRGWLKVSSRRKNFLYYSLLLIFMILKKTVEK